MANAPQKSAGFVTRLTMAFLRRAVVALVLPRLSYRNIFTRELTDRFQDVGKS